MKRQILIILSVLLMLSCAGNKYYYDRMLGCLVESYFRAGVDIMPLLNGFESHLVEKGILVSPDGRGYHRLMSDISNGIPPEMNPELDTFMDIGIIGVEELYSGECIPDVSKLPRTHRQIKRILEQAASGQLDHVLYRKELLKFMSASYFDIPFHRAVQLILLFHAYDGIRIGLEKLIPPSITNDIPDGLKQIKVHIGKNDEIYVDGKKIPENEFSQILTDFIEGYKAESHVIISASRETMYNFYVRVQDTISSVYTGLRDRESLNRFGIPYRELTPDRKEEIELVYPLNISEKEPE